MPKKNDNVVGRSEGPPVGGGRQTAEQAAIVEQGGGSLSDSERTDLTPKTAKRPPTAIGGSSQGQADRMPATATGRRATNPATTPGHTHKTD